MHGYGHERAQSVLGLLWYDSVAQSSKLRAPRQTEAGDVSGGQAHEPFDEAGGEPQLPSCATLNWAGSMTASHGFPPTDGFRILLPVEVWFGVTHVRVLV